MSTRTITVRYRRDGILADADAVILRDPAGTYGLRRVDTGEVLISANTAFTRLSQGIYQIALTDPAPGLVYQYYRVVQYGGAEISTEKFSYPSSDAQLSTYLVATEADALAASLPGIANYKAQADAAVKLAALVQASSDFDLSMPFQGRKYDPRQTLQFPRIPFGLETPALSIGFQPSDLYTMTAGMDMWDYDYDSDQVVVPVNVKIAVLMQADQLLSPADAERQERLQAIADGLSSQSVGSMAEAYTAAAATGAASVLCVRARAIAMKYRLRSGKML